MEMCTANFPLQRNIDVVRTAALWMDTFRDRPDDIMETAVRLCLLNCKTFPTVADIQAAINELLAEQRYEQRKQLPPARSRWMSPAAQKAFDAVRNDLAKRFIAELDVSDVASYAREKFPDISEAMMRRNYAELLTAMQSVEMCRGCMWQTAQCPSAGVYYEPVMLPSGYVKLEAVLCNKKKAAKGVAV